jgi:hypothetical protein
VGGQRSGRPAQYRAVVGEWRMPCTPRRPQCSGGVSPFGNPENRKSTARVRPVLAAVRAANARLSPSGYVRIQFPQDQDGGSWLALSARSALASG